MRRRRPALAAALATLAALAALAAACGGGGGERQGDAPRFGGLDGRALYGQACVACHGAGLQGTDRGPSFLDPIYRPGHHDDAAFLRAVRFGVRSHHWPFGDMPPVAGLTGAQIEAIVAFVRERQRAAGIE